MKALAGPRLRSLRPRLLPPLTHVRPRLATKTIKRVVMPAWPVAPPLTVSRGPSFWPINSARKLPSSKGVKQTRQVSLTWRQILRGPKRDKVAAALVMRLRDKVLERPSNTVAERLNTPQVAVAGPSKVDVRPFPVSHNVYKVGLTLAIPTQQTAGHETCVP